MKPPYPQDAMILEGVMTTLSSQIDPNAPWTWTTSANIAPMGPIVDPSMKQMIFRPFKSSTTYRNLKATGEGVFHITDDALLIARAAMRRALTGTALDLRPATVIRGLVMGTSCRYHELRVVEIDDQDERTMIVAQTVHSERLRDFVGFHRARHAVLEAAILATRTHLTGPAYVLGQYDQLRIMVDKTGTDIEQKAMDELTEFVKEFPKDPIN